MKQFIIDAFTERPFSGNPAAVCLMETWPTEEGMRKLAMENNLSETAFLVPVEGAWELRWFTPAVEVGLCGHATLAAAWAVFRFCTPEAGRVTFRTKSGLLTVTRRGELLEMDFPLTPQREIPVTEEMERAFGLRPLRALL
ncbi:MAG: PhzF family phenazine biosynthesis protein, partial [bacterium]